MKRRRDNILNETTIQKPDVNPVSTDLRSKITAKLQTLLNHPTFYARSKRQIYADLLEEPQHSAIIIDPTVVIKTETPDTEECNENATSINSPNFLSSAKSRITELLNKQPAGTNKYKNCEKENSHSGSECLPVSSVNSATSSLDSLQTQTSNNLQSLSSNSLNKKRKISSSKKCHDTSSDILNNQLHLRSMVVVVEDIMKNRTKYTHLLPDKSVLSETYSSNSEECSKNKNSAGGKQRKSKTTKDYVINEVSNSSCNNVDFCTIDADNTTLSESCTESSNLANEIIINGNNTEFNASKSKSSGNSKIPSSILLGDCDLISEVLDIGDILIERKEPYLTGDDSELVDDPDLHNRVLDNLDNASISNQNQILSNESHDQDVVLLCEMQPTHEVITLEDCDESDEIVEEVHKCDQCGKAFRAKSLLNFHIRMHGSDLSSCNQSSSIS